jgi:phosphoenolpyruvate-protein kinase (PTS system EI component)
MAGQLLVEGGYVTPAYIAAMKERDNALVLLGLGLDEFSMSPAAIPYIKKMIRGISMEQARQIAAKAMQLSDAGLITNYLKEHLPC